MVLQLGQAGQAVLQAGGHELVGRVAVQCYVLACCVQAEARAKPPARRMPLRSRERAEMRLSKRVPEKRARWT